MTVTLPNLKSPLVDGSGLIAGPWVSFFTALVSPAGPLKTVPVPPSPATVTANADGHFIIAGGTVSFVALARGRDLVSTGHAQGDFPVSIGDALVVTYSSAPLIYFVPG
jgi:hypothetical protein